MTDDRKRKKQDNFVLIGFMGCGKTTVGIKLSYLLKRTFADTDKMIEDREGRSISDIFASEGEDAFRNKETELLADLAGSLQGKILSVGGGIVLRPQNRELLKQIGTVVYLRVRPETVYSRLEGDDTRPLLRCEDPLSRITDLLEERKAVYEAVADLVIDADGLSVEQVALRIIKESEA